MISSFKPKPKLSLIGYVPDFAYDNNDHSNSNDNEVVPIIDDPYENDNQPSLSEKLDAEFDGQPTRIHKSFLC
jgi:hypothetical protein